MTEDYRLEDLERTQLETTRRRRQGRSRRYYRLLFVVVFFIALTVLAAPSIVSHTGIAHRMLRSQAATYGWIATADSIEVGWVTPLSIRNLVLVGESEKTRVHVQQLDTALTVGSLVRFHADELGEITVRGVELEGEVFEGGSSIESDLQTLLTDESEEPSRVRSEIKIQDLVAKVQEAETQRQWSLDQANSTVSLRGGEFALTASGLVLAPDGTDGSLRCSFHSTDATRVATDASASEPFDKAAWELSLETQSFPLSVADLVSLRYRNQISAFPSRVSGHTTGELTVKGFRDGAIEADVDALQVRNFHASTETSWNNALATLDGRVALAGGRVFGDQLNIATDFASATLDGAFPATISLIGPQDNPLQWLQTLDGRAVVEVDLAAFDRALPGLIPLRSDATLVSGRARATIESVADRNITPVAGQASPTQRKSRLTLESDSLRARAGGRPVIIQPIELSATVTDASGILRADEFRLRSAFANGSGSGTLRDGSAELQVDFGRLYTMLRPVLDLSELSLGGDADLELQWNVQQDRVSGTQQWKFEGNGKANQLLVTLPSGQRLKRNFVQGKVLASGKWNGRSLQELSSAEFGLLSGGVDLVARLAEPVAKPKLESSFPIALEVDGRLENFSESLRPWLPESLGDLEGRISGSAVAEVSQSSGSLTSADFQLRQPRIHYGNRWYTQPHLNVVFRGVYNWPSGNLHAEELTAVGESISLTARGDAGIEKTHLELAWDANLDGLMRSMETTLAQAAVARTGNETGGGNFQAPVRPIGFRNENRDRYGVRGRSWGKLTAIEVQDGWQLQTEANAENLQLVHTTEPAVGNQSFGSSFADRSTQGTSQTLWTEPKIELVGPVHYDPKTGAVKTDALQITTDWLAGTWGGSVQFMEDQPDIRLAGPTKLRMRVLAERLTQVFGTSCRAEGIHDTNLDLRVGSNFQFVTRGSLGWDALEIASVNLGPARIPIEINSNEIQFARSQIPVTGISQSASAAFAPSSEPQTASLAVGGQLLYASSPMVLSLEPGTTIDQLRVTPEAASTWLRYLAPLAANATRLEGRMSVNLDQARIVIDQPTASKVRGTLNIQDLTMASGPMADQLIQGVEQIKAIASMGAGGTPGPTQAKKLITMPPQTVEFAMDGGVVSHQRMYFEIDRASLMTSGQVGMDTRLNLVAQVPLDARWLGSDLKGLAGQTITLPITGSLSRPQLDSRRIRGLMTELGTRAGAEVIQNRLDGLIEKQFGSSLDQINSGLEKVFGGF